jgi:hypothetical protein
VIPGASVPKKDCAQSTISLEDIAHFIPPSADRWFIPITKAESVLNTSRVDSPKSAYGRRRCSAFLRRCPRCGKFGPALFRDKFGSVAAAHILRISRYCHHRSQPAHLTGALARLGTLSAGAVCRAAEFFIA